jgi:CRISPR-associated RAMP protein (TIGR02581 family)
MNDRFIIAKLKTTAPVHVGSGDNGIAADLPLLRDARGGFYIPGTQIAGRLREIASRLAPAVGWEPCVAIDAAAPVDRGACACRVCRVFGSRYRGNAGDREPGGSASLVWCFDAPVKAGNDGRSLVRDGVGIDRRSGASSHEARALHDAEWIPTGTCFSLRLELEHRATDEDADVLALALSEWAAGRGRIGGGSARGGGAFVLEGKTVEFRRADLSSDASLIDFLLTDPRSGRGAVVPGWLTERTEALRNSAATATATSESDAAVGSFAELSFDLAFEGAMLVNDPAVALAHALNFAPVFGGPGWTGPVLPGSSLRGVLRSQVERIARTLATRAAGSARAFAERCPACDPFRTAAQGDTTHDALVSCADLRKPAKPAGVPEKTLPADCLACALFGSTHQGSRLWIADATLTSKPEYRLRDFVAIDRFTGGAKHGAKFDAVPLYDPVFRPTLLLWNPREWELAALAFALRDLDDGLATVGAHGSKGFGRARVRDVKLRLGRLGARGQQLPGGGQAQPSGVFAIHESQVKGAAGLVELARAGAPSWAAAFTEECGREHRRAVPEGAVADAWFGAAGAGGLTLPELYPAGPVSLAVEDANAR